MESHPYYKLNYYFDEGKMFYGDNFKNVVPYYQENVSKIEDVKDLIHFVLTVFATSDDKKIVAEAKKSIRQIIIDKFEKKLTAATRQILSETIDFLIVCTVNDSDENDTWNYDQWCFNSALIPTEEELF